MISAEVIEAGVLKITAPEKLKADDFALWAHAVEPILARNEKIELLVDLSHLQGWENIEALEKHAAFIKEHQGHIERIAVLVRHEWQHWLISAVGAFLGPELRVFTPEHEPEALRWLATASAKGAVQIVATAAGEPIERLISNITDGDRRKR